MRSRKLALCMMTVALTAGSAFSAFAGTWETQATGAFKYVDAGAYVTSNWVNDNESWYYLDESGIMRNGWLSVGGQWYFLNANGARQTGLIEVAGAVYYMDDTTGALFVGDKNINGVDYNFGVNGTTNGKPTTASTAKFNADGTVDTTTDSKIKGSYGGGVSSKPVPPAITNSVGEITTLVGDIEGAEVTSEVSDTAVTITAKVPKEEADDKSGVASTISSAASTIVEASDDDAKIKIEIPTEVANAIGVPAASKEWGIELAEGKINDWLNLYENSNLNITSGTFSITTKIDGKNVTYKININK